MDTPAISLVDKTRPTESVDELSHSKSHSKRFSKRWARDELIKRKYAKWQPQNLNVPEESSASRRSSRRSSVGRCQDGRRSGISTGRNSLQEVDTVDFATSDQENGNGASIANVDTDNNNGDGSDQDENKPTRELDILYENQRGWFIFGIPLYSHGSLLNFDPSAWVTQELKDSPVNITNAQLPDPSWEWVWHTWYVDMSGDIDEQGWQYSWSFSSTAWHGTHPWFHSFVRRRRWVRMRAKKASERSKRGRSGFEKAHMLNEDYFTIHSSREREATAASSIAPTQLSSNYLSRASTKVAEDVAAFEEIPNIPTLMYAIRVAIVDREKIEALKKFIDNGGEELYYLNERVCRLSQDLTDLCTN